MEAHEGLARCNYCGSALYVDLKEGVGHFMITPVIRKEGLGAHLGTMLARKERKSGLTIDNANIVYWPYWVIQDEKGKQHIFIANAHPVTAMENLPVPSGEQKPYSEEGHKDTWFQPPSGGVEEYIEREKLDAKKSRLVHIPFWQVEYTYDDINYEAWIDAAQGAMYADDLPPTFEKQKDKTYRLAVIIIALTYFIPAAIIPNGNLAVLFMLAASLPLYFVILNMVKEDTG